MPYLQVNKWDKMASNLLLSVAFILTISQYVLSQHIGLAFLQTPSGNGFHEVQVADGRFFIKALVSELDGLVSCHFSEDPEKSTSLLKTSGISFLDIDVKGKMDMWKRCITKEMQTYLHTTKRNGVDGNGVPFTPEKTGDPAGHNFNPAIFPGTKWCGLNNVASSYDDLGKYEETDTCCREHDHCPYFMDHFEEKYHIRNPYPWTVSHCDCDTKLFNCLKGVNTTASDQVGDMFFGLLSVKCIKFEHGQYCVKEHWSKLWCEQTATGEKAVMHEFPHKWTDDALG